ncbi:MAG: Hpt domain-containing protein [Planctomycetaceae bacterium]|jgi:HPt (histidine-containing phosphotransfer) domain-containing protein|nr:Hpt domain-containing protein [Planctomycetaceae bacterium]
MKPIYSSIADESGMWDLVAMFIDEMPERIAKFGVLLESGDCEGLLRFAHQFKGSAGSYGFAELSFAAEKVVTAIKTEQPKNQIAALTKNLIDLCKAASIKPKISNIDENIQ